jgi:outer membrane lipopolysaccharide assembly protein LptE/RlpB
MNRTGVSALLVLVVAMSGCGYRVASKNRLPQPIHTLEVKTLENQTTTYEIEQILTRALVTELVERTSYSVVSTESGADAVLQGRIIRLTANPVTFARTAFASTVLVTVYAAIELTDRRSGAVLFKNDRYIFREQYIVNVDVENFFSEMNPALQRIAGDFAESVVVSITEGF